MGGFTIITGDRKRKIAYVNLPIRNLILKALNDSKSNYILDEGLVWRDPRPYIFILEVKKDAVIKAFKKALEYIEENKNWKFTDENIEWECGENDRTVAIKALKYIIQKLKEYKGKTVIFRDDYITDAAEDYQDLYKVT